MVQLLGFEQVRSSMKIRPCPRLLDCCGESGVNCLLWIRSMRVVLLKYPIPLSPTSSMLYDVAVSSLAWKRCSTSVAPWTQTRKCCPHVGWFCSVRLEFGGSPLPSPLCLHLQSTFHWRNGENTEDSSSSRDRSTVCLDSGTL